jgi:hypothetical protein
MLLDFLLNPSDPKNYIQLVFLLLDSAFKPSQFAKMPKLRKQWQKLVPALYFQMLKASSTAHLVQQRLCSGSN